jgi:hypothetical protein
VAVEKCKQFSGDRVQSKDFDGGGEAHDVATTGVSKW